MKSFCSGTWCRTRELSSDAFPAGKYFPPSYRTSEFFFLKQHFATSLVGKLREDQLELQCILPGLEAGARLWSCAPWSSQEQLFLGWENSFAFA